MIKIYTMVGVNPKNHEVYQFIEKVHDLTVKSLNFLKQALL